MLRGGSAVWRWTCDLQVSGSIPETYICLSRFINSRLNAQYLPSYGLDKKSYMSFRLVPKSVTLNDLDLEMALILPYFTEFGSDPYLFHRIRLRCRRKTIVRLTSVSNLLLIVYDHINTMRN